VHCLQLRALSGRNLHRALSIEEWLLVLFLHLRTELCAVHACLPACSYVPFLAEIFNIVPLSIEEWQLVLLWSLPVILLDEVLKLFARLFFGVRDVKPKMD